MARPGWVRLYPAAGLAGAGSSRASKPADAGKPAPVAAKAAPIDAAQAHPLTWKTVVKITRAGSVFLCSHHHHHQMHRNAILAAWYQVRAGLSPRL